jgi:hypothetical protein
MFDDRCSCVVSQDAPLRTSTIIQELAAFILLEPGAEENSHASLENVAQVA